MVKVCLGKRVRLIHWNGGSIVKSGFENFDPTILELDRNYVRVDNEKHALCHNYVVEFVHDATVNYYKRGNYGCRNFLVIKNTSLYDESSEITFIISSYPCHYVLHGFICLQHSYA